MDRRGRGEVPRGYSDIRPCACTGPGALKNNGIHGPWAGRGDLGGDTPYWTSDPYTHKGPLRKGGVSQPPATAGLARHHEATSRDAAALSTILESIALFNLVSAYP